MLKFMYKLSKSVVPCILLTLCIGFCYAWSLFAPEIRAAIPGSTATQVQFAFCLNIFFLGMGAAFFGPIVEKHIKLAACISSILLFIGLQIAAYGVICKSLMLIYLGFGISCGIAEGCGYVVPVKNLLLWWGKTNHKGVIAALSIIFFGLGSTVCSWLFGFMSSKWNCNIIEIMRNLSYIYLIATAISCIMIDKPKYATLKLKNNKNFNCLSIKEIIKDKFFWQSWIFMFLNISMGLVLIGTCATFLKDFSHLSSKAIIIIMMLCGIANGSGRLVFPLISDFMRIRLNIWKVILVLEIIALGVATLFPSFMPIAAILVNAGYGAAFATLPSVLNDWYGKTHLSEIHGFTLSAWGFASLFAYCVTLLGVSLVPFVWLLAILQVIYIVNLVVVKSINIKK